ncbi:FKBP-type peptidyl-prolyl cis-trans isomerase [Agaribacter flavus]|uniref:Peptidyl-prolyl cis-trans isomerase n=1 Tax=Agaribacter flavus TaxID=1902781 RepID=A0ABV7FQJ7_9ALTE
MKKAYLATTLLAALTLTACGGAKTEDTTETTSTVEESTAVETMTDAQKQSYALGASMGLYVKNRFEEQKKLGLDVSEKALLDGLKDALADNSKFTQTELQQITQAADAALRAAQQERDDKAAEENIAKGKAFLEENAGKEGVKTTESGLQYKVISEAEGESPKATDIVKVHYRGTLLDGTEFDSSHKRGAPAEFPLNQVIPGWTEGVQLMNVGEKYEFFIPSELAYGTRATGKITPNSTLIFEVELLEIVSQGE